MMASSQSTVDSCSTKFERIAIRSFGRHARRDILFRIVKLPGRWRLCRYPEGIVPVEFGSYFVALSKP